MGWETPARNADESAEPVPQTTVRRMSTSPDRLRQLVSVATTAANLDKPARFCLADFAGRLAELSGLALTPACELVLDAQRHDEFVAWITPRDSSFFPPDAAQTGIDLDALVVVRVPTPRDVGRASDPLLRSGAFGLVVLDLGAHALLPTPLQARLLGLAQKHHTALLCLTDKPRGAPSLGSLVSLHAYAHRRRVASHFICELIVEKDKRRGPTWKHEALCHGPAGLR